MQKHKIDTIVNDIIKAKDQGLCCLSKKCTCETCPK